MWPFFVVPDKEYHFINLGEDNECLLPDSDKRFELNDDTKSVTFSYSVNWEASTIRWASRWDAYLAMGDVQIHWFSVRVTNNFEITLA